MAMRGWIVDDDPIFQLTAEQVFRQVSGWDKVESFLRAREALDELQYRHRSEPCTLPDAILLDLNMPVVNGWQFIEEWERESAMSQKDIRIIVVSASLGFSERDRIKGKRSVLSALDKPIQAQELRDLLSFAIHPAQYSGHGAPHIWHSGNRNDFRDGYYNAY